MRFYQKLAFVGLCSAFGFVACSDDSSSTSGESIDVSVISLDESTRTIVYYQENEEELCVLDSANKSASWKTIDEGNDTSSIKYDFITLHQEQVDFIKNELKVSIKGNNAVVFKSGYDYDYSGIIGGIFVGGDNSSIKGTWVSVPCRVYEEGDVLCYSSDDGWGKITLDISSGSIHASYEWIELEDDDYGYDYDYDYDDDDYYTDDISKSGLLYSLYKSLGDAYSSIYIRSGYSAVENNEEDVAEIAQEYNIQENSKSKSSVKFTVNDKTYELSAKKFKLDKYQNLSIDVTLTSDGKSCSYQYAEGDLEGDDIDRDACSSEYFDHYRTDYVHDYTGKKITYGYMFRMENDDEFEDCVYDMAEKKDPYADGYYDDDVYDSDGYFTPMYKKSAASESRAEFWREYNREIKRMLKRFK